MNPEDIELCRQWAAIYRMRGFNPLPSSVDDTKRKKPMCRFAQWWESPAPEDLFDKCVTTNIQLMTGRHWRLMVIDLDGPEAEQRFAKMGRVPPTWISQSGGGGKHLWFRLPDNYQSPLPKGFLWESQARLDAIEFNRTAEPDQRIGLPHEAIERLCDKSLVMAPPSIHPKTGERYKFLDQRQSPLKMPLPANAPQWVLDLDIIRAKQQETVMPLHSPAVTVVSSQGKREFEIDLVLAAIHDKVDLASRWGLRITGTASERGWVPCRAFDRPDHNPSAAIHRDTGVYVDLGSGTTLSYLNLSVAIGVYRDRKDALLDLGRSYASN